MQTKESGRYLNMDIVRYVLSLAVIIAHYNLIMGTDFYWPIDSGTAVGMFFGLSGYLVCGSYLKVQNLGTYVKNRAKRILPPYIFIVTVCCLGLCFLSSLPMKDYLSSAETFKYLLSNLAFLNFLHPDLPGVFGENTVTAVNGSLWTLKVEWALYLSIPVFVYLVRRFKWNITLTICVIFVLSISYGMFMEHLYKITNKEIYHILSYQFVGQLTYFYTGVLVYRYRQLFALKPYLPSLILLVLVTIIGGDYILAPIVMTSIAVIFCISKPINNITRKLGNVSYEMYLFHFPVIQVAASCKFMEGAAPALRLAVIVGIVILLSLAFQKFWGYIYAKNNQGSVSL